MKIDPDDIALRLGSIAVEAGRLLASMADRPAGLQLKDDGSPSTAADIEAERLIVSRLREAWPDIPVVAEETAADPHGDGLFFLVDPLDGTKDYITGAGEYSVNLALVSGDRPIAAALAAPSCGRVWIAGHHALVGEAGHSGPPGSWRRASVRPAPADGLVALVSRRHCDDATEFCMKALPIRERLEASSAYKFALIASGEADLYVRCGPTMEWDTAAGDHILATAGGIVVKPGGHRLSYGHRDRGYLNGPFAAFGDPALASRVRLPQP